MSTDLSNDPIIIERKRLAAERLKKAADLQALGFDIVEKAGIEHLDQKSARRLIGYALHAIEIGMKAERLELGMATEHIVALARPPKPLDQMDMDELRAWRAHLEAISQLP